MKINFIFKILLDILLVLLFLRLADFYILPFYDTNTGKYMSVTDWDFITCVFLFFITTAYTLFLIGIYHLRKTGREFLEKRFFSPKLIKSLDISSNYLISGSILLILSHISMIFYNLTEGLDPVFDFTVIDPLFLMIIGLFFKIQSRSLHQAKVYKDDFDLTI